MSETTYILAGGLDRAHKEYWQDLSRVVDKKQRNNLLSCFFSQPDEDWGSKVEGFTPFFTKAFGSQINIATASYENFRKQVEWADIVYLHGGHTEALLNAMKQYPGIELEFKGKVVIGSSAGANFLSSKYWSPRANAPGVGSGITGLNTMVHFGSQYFENEVGIIDWDSAEKIFQDYIGNSQTIATLEEGKFTIVVKR